MKNYIYETKQQVFDVVYRHLMKQKEKSAFGKNCFYRGPRGLKCAIGILIEDKHFTFVCNTAPVNSLSVETMLRKSGVHPWLFFDGFLSELQSVHDFWEFPSWEEKFKELAARHNLIIPELEENLPEI